MPIDRVTGGTPAFSDFTLADFEAALAELDKAPRETPTMFVYTPTTTRRRDRPATLCGHPVEHLLYEPPKPRLRPTRNRITRRK